MKTLSKTKKPSVSKTSAVPKASKEAPKLKKFDALAVGLLPVKTEGPRIEFRVGSAPTGGRISFEVPKEAKTSLYKYTFTIFFDNSKPKTNIGSAMTVDPRFRVLL
jgi:hypothetical protein